MAGLDILTDLTDEPIGISMVKSQLRLEADFTADDEYIVGVLIPAAREVAEAITARAYARRTYREYFDGFPGQHLPIPYNVVFDFPVRHQYSTIPRHRFELARSPLMELLQIQYLDQDGNTQTLDPNLYVVSDHGPMKPAEIYRSRHSVNWPDPLPRVDSVWVDYMAGYRSPGAEVDSPGARPYPTLAYQAQLLLISHMYEQRLPIVAAGQTELPFTITDLLVRDRVYYQP